MLNLSSSIKKLGNFVKKMEFSNFGYIRVRVKEAGERLAS